MRDLVYATDRVGANEIVLILGMHCGITVLMVNATKATYGHAHEAGMFRWAFAFGASGHHSPPVRLRHASLLPSTADISLQAPRGHVVPLVFQTTGTHDPVDVPFQTARVGEVGSHTPSNTLLTDRSNPTEFWRYTLTGESLNQDASWDVPLSAVYFRMTFWGGGRACM